MNILAKVRAAAFAVWFYSVTLAFCLLGLPVRLFAPRLALLVARNWVRTVLAGMVPIIGIRLVLSGREHLPIDGPALLACQHQSEFDTLVWLTLLKLPSYVMKQELTRIPLFGPLLVPAGMIPVDRSGGAAALRKLLDDAADAARRGRQVVIFPEGTRVPPGQRVPLQPGVAAIAARLNLPVLPVATDSGLRWTRALLSRRSGPIHLMVGPPIAAGTPRKELLAAIEAFWRRADQDFYQAVDNSVDDTGHTAVPGIVPPT
jgi:1-acyl-sn-glycerol-3-phosphate acyltransferase